MTANLFSEHDINPPWEKIHNGIVKAYFAFLVTFGILSIVNSPSCLPTDADITEMFTAPEAEYVSTNCRGQHERNEMTIIVLILSLLHLDTIANLLLGGCVKDSFALIITVEKDFSLLQKRVATGKDLFKRFLDDPYALGLRKIAAFFPGHEGRSVLPRMLFREIILLCGLIGANVALWFFGSPNEMATTYSCTVEYNFSRSQSVGANFTCESPGASLNYRVAVFVAIALSADVLVRFFSLCHLVRFLFKSNPNLQVLSARSMLYIIYLFMASRRKDKRQLGEFMRLLLSSKGAQEMREHVRTTGSDADPLMMKFLSPNHSTILDHDFYGNDDDGRHLINRNSVIPDASFDNDVPLLSIEKSPDSTALFNERQWKWIIFLVDNKLIEVAVLENANKSACDDAGNSLLYYALQLVRDGKIRVSTAAHFLEHIDEVWHHGIKMTAGEYIEEQFVADATYPERLRNCLMGAIKS